MKSRGFCFETTHITDLERVKKLTAIIAIGAAWAHKVGEWKASIKQIIWKQFKGQKRPQYSYFRYGMDEIRQALLQTNHSSRTIKRLFLLLKPNSEIAP